VHASLVDGEDDGPTQWGFLELPQVAPPFSQFQPSTLLLATPLSLAMLLAGLWGVDAVSIPVMMSPFVS
jgi:hypothetical protein